MFYALMGYLHGLAARRVRSIRRLAGDSGQGTVEYVGLILLVSLLMVGMVAAMKGFNRYLNKGGYYYRGRMAAVAPVQAKKRRAETNHDPCFCRRVQKDGELSPV